MPGYYQMPVAEATVICDLDPIADSYTWPCTCSLSRNNKENPSWT